MIKKKWFDFLCALLLGSACFCAAAVHADGYLEGMASLIHYLERLEKEEHRYPLLEEALCLWNKALALAPTHLEQAILQDAYDHYVKACEAFQQPEHALSLLRHSAAALDGLWKQAIEQEEMPKWNDKTTLLRRKYPQNRDFESNSYIKDKIKTKLRPYIISDTHPLKPNLDALFKSERVTRDMSAFTAAGFNVFSTRPRSFICVASHPHLQGYVVKAYMDTELREKRSKASWKWLIERCRGADKVRQVIQAKEIHHFAVASKWIYPLPHHPSPPHGKKYTRHLAVLIATDMGLVSWKENCRAWHGRITKEHLQELYTIISRARGSSYRPDNICYTHSGKFAFIDTEYPAQGPDYSSIRPYLSEEMRSYWDYLIRNGGWH